jgi:putative endonuclease
MAVATARNEQDLLRLRHVQQIPPAYTDITSDLVARAFQHKNKWHEGSITVRYRFDVLVYFEAFSNPNEAIARENEIKSWRREKKPRLVF